MPATMQIACGSHQASCCGLAEMAEAGLRQQRAAGIHHSEGGVLAQDHQEASAGKEIPNGVGSWKHGARSIWLV